MSGISRTRIVLVVGVSLLLGFLISMHAGLPDGNRSPQLRIAPGPDTPPGPSWDPAPLSAGPSGADRRPSEPTGSSSAP